MFTACHGERYFNSSTQELEGILAYRVSSRPTVPNEAPSQKQTERKAWGKGEEKEEGMFTIECVCVCVLFFPLERCPLLSLLINHPASLFLQLK